MLREQGEKEQTVSKNQYYKKKNYRASAGLHGQKVPSGSAATHWRVSMSSAGQDSWASSARLTSTNAWTIPATHPVGTDQCLDQVNKYHYQCWPGLTGALCENKINDCPSRPALTVAPAPNWSTISNALAHQVLEFVHFGPSLY